MEGYGRIRDDSGLALDAKCETALCIERVKVQLQGLLIAANDASVFPWFATVATP